MCIEGSRMQYGEMRVSGFSYFNGRLKKTNVKRHVCYRLRQSLAAQPLLFQHDANNHFYYAYSDPVLPRLLGESLAYKRPDTSARQPRRRCKETSVHGKMGKHFYVCANWNFQMGVYRLSQPRALLPEMWNLLRYNDVASSITHSGANCFQLFAWMSVF